MNTRRRFLAGAAAACVAPAILTAQTRRSSGLAPGGPSILNAHAEESAPRIALNNGVKMPQLGFGTFGIKPEQAPSAVSTAIGDGFRLIDTAKNYGNETEVGLGIARSGISRNELFVTTKLWIEDFGYDPALRAFDLSMEKLKLDYLDLYLLHWPVPAEFDKTIAAYKALEKLHSDGRIRAIGVSNFNPEHLDRLMAQAKIVPAVNQVEINPWLSQENIRAENAKRGIITESWSPLGSNKNVGQILAIPQIRDIAQHHGKSPAQVVIRWHLQHGLVVIPRSINPQHIAENIDVFGFTLSGTEMAAIDRININRRTGPDPATFDVEAYKKLVSQRSRA